MRKNILALISFLSVIVSSYCQPSFSVRYNLPLNDAKLIKPSNDGGFYFFGNYLGDVVFGKIDSVGNLEWAKQMGYDSLQEFSYGLITLDNGDAVVALSSSNGGTVIKTNIISFSQSGNLKYIKQYSNLLFPEKYWPNNLEKTTDGFCIAVTTDSSIDTHFMKVDVLGRKEKSTSIERNRRRFIRKSDGGYILFAQAGFDLVVFDSLLNYQETRVTSIAPFPNTVGMIEISPGSYFQFGSSPNFVAKLNQALDYQWLKTIEIPGATIGKVVASQKISDNRFAFYGQGENSGFKPYYFVLDTLGNLIDCKLITTNGMNTDYCPGACVFKNDRFTFMYNEIIPNFGYYFKISSDDTTFSNTCNVVDTTMTLDPWTTIPSDPYSYNSSETRDTLLDDSIPITQINFNYGACNDLTLMIPEETLESSFKVFPNPFDNDLKVEIDNNEIYVITIYDMTARKILQEKFRSSTVINTEFFAKGIYLFDIQLSEKCVKRGKLLKL